MQYKRYKKILVRYLYKNPYFMSNLSMVKNNKCGTHTLCNIVCYFIFLRNSIPPLSLQDEQKNHFILYHFFFFVKHRHATLGIDRFNFSPYPLDASGKSRRTRFEIPQGLGIRQLNGIDFASILIALYLPLSFFSF